VGPRDLKRALARGVVARFHGDEAAAAAEQHFERLFVTHEAPDDVETWPLRDDPVHLPGLIAEAFGRSRSDARRLLDQGGVKLDGAVLDGGDLDVAADALDGRVLQVGKRHFRRLERA
jgi:tyrosyl-tRNA synthetase